MDIHIHFVGEVSDIDSFHLNSLAHLIEQEMLVEVKIKKLPSMPGIKDDGLTMAIAIAGLALSGVSTLISVITYWQSQQTRYSISIDRDGITYYLENLTREEYDELSRILQVQELENRMDVKISSKGDPERE